MFQRSTLIHSVLATSIAALLAACGGGGDTASLNNDGGTNAAGGDVTPPVGLPAPTILVANAQNPDFANQQRTYTNAACDAATQGPADRPTSYPVYLNSASGQVIAFTVFEPTNFDCESGNPLVLQGHGFGGAREREANGTITRFNEAGIGVISIDQRGFGESSGSVRVMDPDFEGQDLLQILDWAEQNLDWLRYRNDGSTDGRGFNMVAGSYGGSYGGGYQMLIHNIDPLHRLDAMAPDITWNDLRYSLNPGAVYGVENYQPAEGEIAPIGTVKSAWSLLLVAGGEAGSLLLPLQNDQPGGLFAGNEGLDMVIRETLLRGITSNRFPDGALEFFRYHSPSYYCDTEVAGEQTFLQGTATNGVSQAKPVGVDILFTQGFRDTLFNFNDAFHNFACYRNLTKPNGDKPDVRLFTHQSGHILPSDPQAEQLAQQFAANGANYIEFQGAAGPEACGEVSKNDAQFVFLSEKLLTAEELAAVKSAQSDDGKNAYAVLEANKGKVCLSYDDITAENVWVDEELFLSTQGPKGKGKDVENGFAPVTLDLPVGDPTSTVTTGLLGVADYLPAPAMQAIDIPVGVEILAGVPTATITIAPIQDALANPACEQIQSGAAALPTGLLGLDPACDPIVYFGLGVTRDGVLRLIDGQVTPVRGYGTRHVEMTGIAEKLSEGDQLSVIVYGYHPQYFGTSSRDVLSPVVNVSGEIKLPWVDEPVIVID